MKQGLSCLLMLLVFASVAGGAESKNEAPSQEERCPVCGMFVAPFVEWNTEIRFADATRAVFDGPKDLFKYYLDLKKYNLLKTRIDVTAIAVKDYYTKSAIDGRKAFFVIWGDVYGPMGNEPVPFEKEADAQRFLQEHKGRKILRFKDITPKLIHALDNP